MTCCVILHNMIIESEQEEPVFDTEPYYRQGPLAEVDHQLPAPELPTSVCVRRSETHRCIISCSRIWWSTYGGSRATPGTTCDEI